MAKRKKRVGVYRHLQPISASKGKKAISARRCKWIGGDEGGSTYQCGKQVYVHDYVNERYYRMRGKNASYVGYAARQRRKSGER